ncbi:MAG TPA: periplasmic heavy metal sensor [Thermoanaerobaculia bacterium]|jgi:Spy/CpxP family protein refolding chaperone
MSSERGRARTTALAILVLLVTFVAGAVVGIAAHRGFMMRGHERGAKHMTAFMLNHLDRKLDLTDAQRGEIEKILDRRHQRMSALRGEMRGKIEREVTGANAEIERVLDAQQREKFKRLRIHLRHPPPPGPPPE